MDRQHALSGALVADAASMGLHWLYDQEQIKTLEQSGDIMFRQPDGNVFKDKRGHFAHGALRSGNLSHYGESARIVGQLVIDQSYAISEHQRLFFDSFGPCGYYCGYADRPTKMLVAKMIIEGEELSEPSGMDDNQMPAFSVVSGLFAAAQSRETIVQAAQVISTHKDVIAGINAVHSCLEMLLEGATLPKALSQSASTVEGELGELMREALALEGYQPLDAARQFGLACYVTHSLPVVWHLLQHATAFETVVADNIRCGGDNCGRSMALGAIAGLAFGVPDKLVARMTGGRVPIYQ